MKYFINILKTKDGFLSIGAAISLVLLGFFAVSAGSIMTQEIKRTGDATSIDRAEQIATTAMEWVRREIDNGRDPAVNNFEVAHGSFSVTTQPPAVIIAAQSGDTQVTRRFDTFFGDDCMSIECTNFSVGGPNDPDGKIIHGLSFVHSCLNTNAVSYVAVRSEPASSNKIKKVKGNNNNSWENSQGKSQGEIIDVADITLPGVGETAPLEIEFDSPIQRGKTWQFELGSTDGSRVVISCQDNGTNPAASEPEVDPTPGFTLDNGEIHVDTHTNLEFNILCSELTYGPTGEKIGVKVNIGRDGVYTPPWLFNNRPVQGGEHYIEIGTGNPNGAKRRFKAQANYKSLFSFTTQTTNLLQVKTLVNGDTPPPLAGYGGQQGVKQCIAPYLNSATGKVQLDPSEVIMLFELGVDLNANPNSTAADFQDLVIKAKAVPMDC